MSNQEVVKLEQAINALESAKSLIREALGDTDSYHMTADDIDCLIEDLDADIVYFRDGQPR